jgi:hypothetical protein
MSIENKKTELMNREATTNDLPGDQRDALDLLRKRGSVILLTSAIAGCIETILNRRIPNLFKVSFGSGVSPSQAEEFWGPIIEIAIPFAPLQLSTSLGRGIDRSELTKMNIKKFISMISATAKTNKTILDIFASRVAVAS